ncbi:hypothetical protein [Streptomyces cinereoruber]|uniref:hypothetical protein n=1 Tax=Streptomyces cinereoruber TaxID=67260 RepID=UPI00363233F8
MTTPHGPVSGLAAPLLTIRISRDSGRTYGPPVTVTTEDNPQPLASSQWPPCRCPQHRP